MTENNNHKTLIVYYSYTKNTQKIAELIQNKTNGDIFEITINHKYPKEYTTMTEQVKKELQDNFLPQLISKIDNIDDYDTIFLGSPNWWGTITPAVRSFLNNYNLNNKIIIPFITHGGGGVQNTIKDIAKLCNNCVIIKNGWIGYENKTENINYWIDEIYTTF